MGRKSSTLLICKLFRATGASFNSETIYRHCQSQLYRCKHTSILSFLLHTWKPYETTEKNSCSPVTIISQLPCERLCST